jgi:hypothetical protein
MKKLMGCLVGLFVVVGYAVGAGAQGNSGGASAPPKVLVVSREYLKPGKGGALHNKSESAFVQAFTRAKWPTHYLAMDSLSGKTRTLFLIGYDSFDAWEKDVQATQKNATLSAALDRATAADGELQNDYDQGVFVLRPDYSQHPGAELPHMRYFEFEAFHVRPGRESEWEEAVKMVKAGYEKGEPDVQWAMYQGVFGRAGGTYVVITPRKSAAEIDHDFAEGPKFAAAMGEKGMKKLGELSAASIESSETNLFAFNPRMSYVSDEFANADAEFWKPKPAMPVEKKSKKMKDEEKPATNP